jgi:hypothetical protein
MQLPVSLADTAAAAAAAASPQHTYTLQQQQQQQEAAAAQHIFHSQLLAGNSGAAAAAATGLGNGSLTASIMQLQQLEVSNALLAKELLEAQTASAVQAAMQQQQQLYHSMLLQDFGLAGTFAGAGDCMSAAAAGAPEGRPAAWQGGQGFAATAGVFTGLPGGVQQQGLHEMLLLAGLPGAGVWG